MLLDIWRWYKVNSQIHSQTTTKTETHQQKQQMAHIQAIWTDPIHVIEIYILCKLEGQKGPTRANATAQWCKNVHRHVWMCMDVCVCALVSLALSDYLSLLVRHCSVVYVIHLFTLMNNFLDRSMNNKRCVYVLDKW